MDHYFRLLFVVTAAAVFLAAWSPANAAGEGPPQADSREGRLGHDVVPRFEAIGLRIDPSADRYSGSAHVDLEVLRPARSFRFHALDVAIEGLGLEGPAGPVAATHASDAGGIVTVRLQRPLPRGRYAMTVAFGRPFGARATGLYRVKKGSDAYTFTDLEPNQAREAWPCWDEPEFKIPFQLTVEVPEGNEAVSNTPIESESVQAGWKKIRFARTRPLPTYLLALATGPLEFTPIPELSIPGRVVTVKGQSGMTGAAASMTPSILSALESWFDSKYPFEKLDLIAVPEFWPGAMENPGAITFADRVLLLDPRAISAEQKSVLARVLAHELAHMWFGDLVTMRWWDDLWLNESFADWMGDRIAAQVHPELGLELAEVQSVQNIMVKDARPSTLAIRRPIRNADESLQDVGLAYNKGKSVLGMFEAWVGPDRFRRGVQDYLRAHAWGNAAADDLWRALSKAAGRDLTGPMSTFIDQPGVPIVSAEILPNGRVRFRQRRFSTAGSISTARSWKIPMLVRYASKGQVQTHRLLLDRTEATVELSRGGRLDWVLPNADARGYYRWGVDPQVFETLAGSARGILSARERVAFVGNLAALLDSGSLHGDTYLKHLAPFAGDAEPQVVKAVVAGLEKVRESFVPEGLETAFAAWVRVTLGPVLEKIGLEARPGEPETTSRLRPDLLDWLGRVGRDEKVLAFARTKTAAYLDEPSSIDPSIAGVVLRLAALEGDEALFEAYRKRFESAQAPADRSRLLGGLASFRGARPLERALAYSLEGPLRPNEVLTVPRALAESAQTRDRGYRWVTENFDRVGARIPREFYGFLTFIAAGCEPERVLAAKEFFSAPGHRGPGTDHRLAEIADAVEECARLRAREGAAVKAFLEPFAREAGAGELREVPSQGQSAPGSRSAPDVAYP